MRISDMVADGVAVTVDGADSAKRARAELRARVAFGLDVSRGSAYTRERAHITTDLTQEQLEAAIGIANAGGCDEALVSFVILALVAEIERFRVK